MKVEEQISVRPEKESVMVTMETECIAGSALYSFFTSTLKRVHVRKR